MDRVSNKPGQYSFESFKDNLVRMVRTSDDPETSDCFRDIAVDMLKGLNTVELEELGVEILKRRALNCGSEDESVRHAMFAAEGYRRRAVIARARKVLLDEEGIDWSKVGLNVSLDYRPAETGRADIDGCPYVEIYANLKQLEDVEGFINHFENRNPKNIRVTDAVNDCVNIYIPLDYVMSKEGLAEAEGAVESSVNGANARALAGWTAERSEAIRSVLGDYQFWGRD